MTTKPKRAYSTSYHLCVSVDRAIKELNDGNNLFDCPVREAWRALLESKAAGKDYITGCSREGKDGRCKGHRKYKPLTKDND